MGRAEGALPVLGRSRFVSFDGSVVLTGPHQRPDRYRQLEVDLGAAKRIARGAGLSYAAASFGPSSVVQDMSAFDRVLELDADGLSLRVEAGCTVGRVLELASRHGLHFPVLPGYPSITVGGCIAADVHGKNPMRDGTFGDWVDSMTLYHPAHGLRSISRSESTETFEATCGGYGLTGLIVDARLRLTELPAKNVLLRNTRIASLLDAVEALRANATHDFAYSWHDGAARGREFGRGVLFLGSWGDDQSPGSETRYHPLTSHGRARLPLSLWRRPSIKLANQTFRYLSTRRETETKSLFDAAFPFAGQTAYHRFYGRRGLAEAQLLVPDASFQQFVERLGALVHQIDPNLVMMSVKRFQGRQRSLAMCGSGSLLALDLTRDRATARFLSALDALALETGAQPNAAKDSRLPADVAARALPHYHLFRERVQRLDPARLYESELSRRLEL